MNLHLVLTPTQSFTLSHPHPYPIIHPNSLSPSIKQYLPSNPDHHPHSNINPPFSGKHCWATRIQTLRRRYILDTNFSGSLTTMCTQHKRPFSTDNCSLELNYSNVLTTVWSALNVPHTPPTVTHPHPYSNVKPNTPSPYLKCLS